MDFWKVVNCMDGATLRASQAFDFAARVTVQLQNGIAFSPCVNSARGTMTWPEASVEVERALEV